MTMPIEVAEIAARNEAFNQLGPLKISFSKDGVEYCKFCEQPLVRHSEEMFGRTFNFGHEKCKCPDAVAAQFQYDSVFGLIVAEQMDYHRKQRVEKLFRDSMIPKRWENRTFEHFEVSPKNQQAYDKAKQYADAFTKETTDGLLFSGTVGTGKTHLSAAIALTILEREYTVMFGTVTTLLSQIRSTFNNRKASEQEVFDDMVRSRLLIIDDIGKEKSTEWVEQTLYEIVNSRYENNKPVIITTNMSLSELKDRYPNVGEALVDRILEMCQGVKMVGDSWRKKHLL